MGLLKAATPANLATPAPAPPRPAPTLDELLAGLISPDAAARRQSARALSAHPAAAPALASALPNEAERPVQQALIGALTKIGGPVAVGALVSLLRTDDAWLRNAAQEALQAIGPAAVAAVRRQLADTDPCARIAAVVTLSGLPAAEAEPLLIAAIDAEPSVNVVAAIIEALDVVGGPAAAAALDRLAQRPDTDPFLVFAAAAVRDRMAGVDPHTVGVT